MVDGYFMHASTSIIFDEKNIKIFIMSLYVNTSSDFWFKFRYIKFDTFTPAAERGLPVTRVISRMTLQQILARAVGDDVIMNESNVVDFVDDGNKVI